MKKYLIIPDVHGRSFWQAPCDNIEDYEKVIFLGDYFDPYDFEGITVPMCIENFNKIMELKKNNMDKVVLLLGNHDCPYVFKEYFNLSSYHCRHSSMFHKEISELFNSNIDYFKISHVEGDVLFTHAGVESGWLENIVKCDKTDIDGISDALNGLMNDADGLRKLYCVSFSRGGRDKYGSCVWSDVSDVVSDIDSVEFENSPQKPIHSIKQVFGHTLQAYYGRDNKIFYGDAVEYKNCKMLDTARAYELDIINFEIKVL